MGESCNQVCVYKTESCNQVAFIRLNFVVWYLLWELDGEITSKLWVNLVDFYILARECELHVPYILFTGGELDQSSHP
jgi:hypothetical protein